MIEHENSMTQKLSGRSLGNLMILMQMYMKNVVRTIMAFQIVNAYCMRLLCWTLGSKKLQKISSKGELYKMGKSFIFCFDLAAGVQMNDLMVRVSYLK